ncbi:MAG: sulfatase-like hydrolase/transferase [Acidimicrobiales bacterium]
MGSTAEVNRFILPIHDPQPIGITTYDAKDPETSYPPITEPRPPAGVPNVLIVLLDDIGFGASSAFGGAVNTPTAERLAAGGIKLTRFHTTALCAPTRAALLTGRNHHTVGMGSITETATSAPGYTSVRPKSTAPLAEILKQNGYSTAQFGKCHEVPVWKTSPVGPFDLWPTGSGFDYFYGFIGGETNQYYPALYEGTTPVEPPSTPAEGYHLTDDMTDKAIAWFRQQRALQTDKPFFAYYAPGATHAPHHVATEWSDRYKGRFDAGWDALREEVFARQKELGVIPADADLTARPEEIEAWDELPDILKPVLARQMEVYAGFLEHTDHAVGRVIDVLEELDVLDDTLIYYIIGDNGASAEGTPNGTFNELFSLNGAAAFETAEFMAANIDKFGTPEAYNHYAVGCAHAMCTPYQWTKQVASHFGGTRNGTIIHWPNGFTAKGEVRDQFHHVIDVATTVLDVAHLPEPTMVNGFEQQPLQGISMTYLFDDANAADRRETQYFEMLCNRGIYHKGWMAVTRHSVPWLFGAVLPPLDDDIWELYDTTSDWTQAHDLAAERPDVVAHLQRLFLIEAVKHQVFPLDDRRVERFNSDLAGRPSLITGPSQLVFGGMGRLTENTVLNLKNKSYTVTADIEIPDGVASGVIVAQGGAFGGWSLYLNDGVPIHCYNLLGLNRVKATATEPLNAGHHQVRVEFVYDGDGLAKGGDTSLFVDGTQVGSARQEASIPMLFSGDETLDVGVDYGSSVSDDYTPDTSRFTGTVNWVQLDQGSDDHSHLIRPEDRLSVAMARQ